MGNSYLNNCKEAIEECINTTSYAVFHSNKSDYSIDMHIHNCCEVFLNISGGRNFIINNKVYEIEKNDLFFINEFEAHKITHDEGCLFERYVLKLHPFWISSNSDEDTNLGNCFYTRNKTTSNRITLTENERNKLVELYNKLKEEEVYGSKILKTATMLETVVWLNRLFMANNTCYKNTQLKETNDTIIKIIGHINHNLQADLSLDALSTEFFISKNHLLRLFKKYLGTTVLSYVNARRISNAKSLLAMGYSVKDAGEQSGFNDYSHFIRTFSAVVGTSPKRFNASFSNSDRNINNKEKIFLPTT